MKRSHSLTKTHAEESHLERSTKIKVVFQDSPEMQRVITGLEKEIESLRKEAQTRGVEVKKAERELLRKQEELDESIVEVMNWVPEALIDAQNKHDSTYRLLLQTSLELIECQSKLNIPLSLTFPEESSFTENKSRVDAEITDVNYLLARELQKAKVGILSCLYVDGTESKFPQELHKQEIAVLKEKVAMLEARLAALEVLRMTKGKSELRSAEGCDKDDQDEGQSECNDGLKLPKTRNVIEVQEKGDPDDELVLYL
ncbi:hypothetical protein F5050DRAFT_1812689 [Lentinula boryana]|uniref:Uncharacterized protein n=1 Tax=Lentinula boryana TaxID=40481 RepID=A0ABQ8Q0G3_9AGAR|nr:hypothetical protein F5050DRAFT_1812689 [Lentinula boryana]